jgi:hypothetical protein
MNEKMGDKSTCQMCGAEIEYVGPYWRHTGDKQPRHPAMPIEQGQAPGQPKHWFTQLTPRDQEQVRHARDYAQTYASAGAPGHSQFLLIAKLADLLDGHVLKNDGGA